MTLWINGDWITGQGERRRKTNPVSAEILWQGMTLMRHRSPRPVRRRARRFLVGPESLCRTTGYRREICRPAGGA